MRANIHPDYAEITVTCSCGNKLKVHSTLKDSLHIDVCSQCHPFYTGQQKIIDTTGRVERYNKRYNIPGVSQKDAGKSTQNESAEASAS